MKRHHDREKLRAYARDLASHDGMGSMDGPGKKNTNVGRAEHMQSQGAQKVFAGRKGYETGGSSAAVRIMSSGLAQAVVFIVPEDENPSGEGIGAMLPCLGGKEVR